MLRATNATTRTATRSATDREPLLERGEELASDETGHTYRVERLIGQGGFGQVYLARRRGRSATVPEIVCIKASRRLESWIREAYFGQLLHGHPRAIAVYDPFIISRRGRPLYCLALEYAAHGDLSAYLAHTGRRWAESTVRREIAGILDVLGRLHRGQLLHRDLTPLNVFVCDRTRLKLGDFGIVRHQAHKRGITVRTLNPHMAPSEIFDGAAPKWQARDDVYQVGQLIGMLIRGDASARLRPADVRGLPCSDHLKEIVYRCIGERRKRYDSAKELIDALSTPPASLRSGAVRTLKGVHLAFTGIFTRLRRELERAARAAGAVVHGMPSSRTTVLVRGRPNVLQAAGRDAGRKLIEIKRLRDKGHRVTIITEERFWRLVSPASRHRR
jgi:serine/threonine-protein kinase